MKFKHVLFAMMFIFLLNVSTNASAVTFEFDPDSLLQLFPGAAGTADTTGENKATQINARRVHEVWGGQWHETFYNPAAPQTQPDSYNTYMNWAEGLGTGEGIGGFNIWLQDNPRARSWGETAVWNPNGAAPTGTADADGNWNVSVDANPWGTGWLVSWWTDDPDYYLNLDSDIGMFSFSGDAYWDNNSNAYDSSDTLVQLGEEVRIWFGSVNYTESDGAGGWIENQSVFFDDDGWGNRTPAADPFSQGFVDAQGYGSGYEGVLQIQATPEPTTMLLFGLGLLGFAGISRKKK